LAGRAGIYSAVMQERGDAANNAKLLEAWKAYRRARGARLFSVLVLMIGTPKTRRRSSVKCVWRPDLTEPR